MLQFLELQRVGHDLVTEEQQNKHLCKAQWEQGERFFKPDWENRLTDMERGEERVRCMERVTQKLTLPCVK